MTSVLRLEDEHIPVLADYPGRKRRSDRADIFGNLSLSRLRPGPTVVTRQRLHEVPPPGLCSKAATELFNPAPTDDVMVTASTELRTDNGRSP